MYAKYCRNKYIKKGLSSLCNIICIYIYILNWLHKFLLFIFSDIFLDYHKATFIMISTWEDFYAKQPPPQDLAQNEKVLKEFTKQHLQKNNKVVLVTVRVSKF